MTECEFCARLGKRLRVDHDKDERLPLEVQEFAVRTRDGEILQCGRCRTYYRFVRVCDNDLLCPQHTEEIEKMSATEAETLIEAERFETEVLGNAIRGRFGSFLKTASEAETKLFALVLERRWDGMALCTIKSRLPDEPNLEQLLASLVDRQILLKRVCHSLHAGRSGFQETDPQINDWNVIYSVNYPYSEFQCRLENKKRKVLNRPRKNTGRES